MICYISAFKKIILTVKDTLTLGGVPRKLVLHWVLYKFNANGAPLAIFWTANIFFLFEELPKNVICMKSVILMNIRFWIHLYRKKSIGNIKIHKRTSQW